MNPQEMNLDQIEVEFNKLGDPQHAAASLEDYFQILRLARELLRRCRMAEQTLNNIVILSSQFISEATKVLRVSRKLLAEAKGD